MNGETVMQVSYSLPDKEKLFSLAYSVYINRRNVLHKDAKVSPFPDLLRRSRLSAAVLGAVILAYIILMIVDGVDALGVGVLILAAIYCAKTVWELQHQQRNYEYALNRYLESGESEGVLHFDERGITDVSVSGKKRFFSWEDYRYCLLLDGGIMFLYSPERDATLMVERTGETEKAVREILTALERDDTIREPRMKETRTKK